MVSRFWGRTTVPGANFYYDEHSEVGHFKVKLNAERGLDSQVIHESTKRKYACTGRCQAGI